MSVYIRSTCAFGHVFLIGRTGPHTMAECMRRTRWPPLQSVFALAALAHCRLVLATEVLGPGAKVVLETLAEERLSVRSNL